MTVYEKELQAMKPEDEIQETYKDKNDLGYDFIMTAGHGYLVVPHTDKNSHIASKIVAYGYKGRRATYLEEDCEAGEFLTKIKGGA